MAARILIADDDAALRESLQTMLEKEGFVVIAVPSGEALIRAATTQQPDLIITDVIMPGMDGLEALRQLRNDTRTSHLPMLLLTSMQRMHGEIIGFESGADDYIAKPFEPDAILARIRAALRRQTRVQVVNPLTHLPGTIVIADESQRRLAIGEPFALYWLDLDNFKALNDAYGFARGDRVIKLLADILRDMQMEYDDAQMFVGHIGGDDFVALTTPPMIDELCRDVIARFDHDVRTFYNGDDLERGYLHGADRFGMPRRFPIVGVSIGVVTTEARTFSSYDELSLVASEVKGKAKKYVGSSYAVDGRVAGDPVPPNGERRQQALRVAVVGEQPIVWDALQPLLADGRCHGTRFTTPPLLAPLLDTMPDLITLHVDEPRCWALANALRESKPAIPLILVSRHADDETRAYACGAWVFMRDPFPHEYYRATIAQLLRLNEHTPPTERH
jgi:DNA-binding response OmpR family regulator